MLARYSAWLESSFPRVVVRLEDLLLRQEALVRAVCSCVGGNVTEGGFRHVGINSTKGLRGGYLRTLPSFGNATLRTAEYGAADLAYFDAHVDVRLLEIFGYRRSDGRGVGTRR